MNSKGTTLSASRRRSVEALLAQLPTGVELSQKELAELTGLSEATISNLGAFLVDRGVVEITVGTRNGRRANLLRRVVDQRGLLVGVSVTRTRMDALAVHPDGSVVKAPGRERAHPFDYADELVRVVEAIELLTADAPAPLVGIGVGLGVTVDPVTERVGGLATPASELIPGFNSSWSVADIGADLRERFGVSTSVLNDGDAGALAEVRTGAAAGCDDVVYVHLGDGVGGGLVLGGRLYRGGKGGFPGEIGHLSTDPDGPLCICGNRGCLEPLFGSALLGTVAGVHGSLSMREFADLAHRGDPACLRALREVAVPVTKGLANPVALLAPERVVLGGELSAAGAALLTPISELSHSFGWAWRGEIVLSELGADSVGLGAAYAAGDRAAEEVKFKI